MVNSLLVPAVWFDCPEGEWARLSPSGSRARLRSETPAPKSKLQDAARRRDHLADGEARATVPQRHAWRWQ